MRGKPESPRVGHQRPQVRFPVDGYRLREHSSFVWREEGGPTVNKAASSGFGSAIIRSAFSKGDETVEIELEPQGVTCRMLVPLTVGSNSRGPETRANIWW